MKSNDFHLPADFPDDLADLIEDRLRPFGNGQPPPSPWLDFAGGWNALRYRFRTLADRDESFRRMIGDSVAPPGDKRYQQEQCLFDFFVNGLASIEAACFGLHGSGALIDVAAFPMSTDDERRNVKPKFTQKCFAAKFPTYAFSNTLQQIITSREHKDLGYVRNYLAHRALPGRTFFQGGEEHGRAVWTAFDIQLNGQTTSGFRAWIADTLTALLGDAFELLDQELPR